MADAQIDRERVKRQLRSQIGDDVREIYDHEALFGRALLAIDQAEAELAKAVEALDKIKRIDNLVGVFAACERTLAELTGDGDENDTN